MCASVSKLPHIRFYVDICPSTHAIIPRMNPTKKEKILVIESDAAFGERISDALKAEGYFVSLQKDGAEGLKAMYDTLPHLIIIDIFVAGMDGYEILAKKSAEPLLAKIPVFLISTQSSPIDMHRVPQGSVKEFILDMHADIHEIVRLVNTQCGYDTQATPVAEPTTGKKKLFWLEDDKLIGTILAKKLIASGFELTHAQSGPEALEMLKTAQPDVIALDLLVPGMNGLDILQKIKADPRLKNVPSMILSNLNKQSDIERAKLLGAQKFLVKAATSLDQIVAEIKDLCK
jgi:CheY-like chemotaxis protein